MSDEVVVEAGKFALARKRRAQAAGTAALAEAHRRDELTGLVDRAMLTEALSQRIAAKPEALALLAVGLRHIAALRESHGLQVADAAFKAVAERLTTHVRAADVLARSGEHTLVLLLGQVAKEDRAAAIAKRVLADLTAPVVIDGAQFHIDAGIGVSMYPRDGDDAVALIDNAQAALHATAPHGETVNLYSRALGAESQARLTLEAALRRAVAGHAFELVYQPCLDVPTGRIVGAQALPRWHDPDHGQVSPELFVPLLESTGLIVQVGTWIINEAARTLARWHPMLPHLQISVAISALQVRGPSVATLVRDALRAVGMPDYCGGLEVELPGSLLMSAHERHHLHDMANANIPLALGDLGASNGALGALLDMPFDVLKVRRGVVQRLPFDSHVCRVMNAIIAMAHTLDMRVVAQGVSTQAELDKLAALQCDHVQGELTGRPMPATELEALLSATDTG